VYYQWLKSIRRKQNYLRLYA